MLLRSFVGILIDSVDNGNGQFNLNSANNPITSNDQDPLTIHLWLWKLHLPSHSLEIWAHFPNLQAGDLAGDADNSSPTVVLDKLAQTFRSSNCQGSFPS
ncbi:hypothetical protein RHSIM_Rhsim02G0057900 [Rhododendron simsii]|uniref:Uncharacterized protein n=1 Tax=Rhododendron simsii TaxID=118357 RepID=A0A834HEZ1_RHOSS|nr:hypothetical protein RHSIM_Rhsim02G0057900 [Rhododendron simsii]